MTEKEDHASSREDVAVKGDVAMKEEFTVKDVTPREEEQDGSAEKHRSSFSLVLDQICVLVGTHPILTIILITFLIMLISIDLYVTDKRKCK